MNNTSIKVAGFVSNSFVDYPGKIAAVIFLGGCNFACHYCHNSHIMSAKSNTIDFNGVLEKINDQKNFLDVVVISGGEPTMHPDLLRIIAAVRQLGLLVKLDTNGANPKMLRKLVDEGQVDYVAMDIKAPLARYKDIIGVVADTNSIKESIDFLINQDRVEYMFRTTLSPFLTEGDIKDIGKLTHGAKLFQLQQFVPNDFSNSHSVIALPYQPDQANRFANILKKHANSVLMRGF